MHGKWKSLFALGMAALIGCMMPAGTMLAAEDEAEIGLDAGSVSDNTVLGSGSDTLGDTGDAENGAETNTDTGNDQINTDAGNGQTNTDGSTESDKTDLNPAADVDEAGGVFALTPAAEQIPEADSAEAAQSAEVPVITFKWNGQDKTCELGGAVSYEYVNNTNQSLECSVTLGGQAVPFSFSQDKVADMTAEAKGSGQMDALAWTSVEKESGSDTLASIQFLNDGNYVVYVKVEADGQFFYKRSCGIVVDTQNPKVVRVEEGKSYAEGTAFEVQDANLKSVTINEQPAEPAADGTYKVTANGASCVIKAEDKAGNKVTCTVNVSGKDPAQDGNVISESGRYALQEGVRYQLAEGKWGIFGDRTVYAGGGDIYVKTAGDYLFMKE